MSRNKSRWLTKKQRRRILKRLYWIASNLNHTKDCNVAVILRTQGFDAFVELVIDENNFRIVRMKQDDAPQCTCGCDEVSSLVVRAITILGKENQEMAK